GGDGLVRTRIYIRIDPKCDRRNFAHLGSKLIDHIQLLNRFHVECKNILFKRIADLFVRFSNTCKHNLLWRESDRDRFAYFIARYTISANTSLPDARQDTVIKIGLQCIMQMKSVSISKRSRTIQRISQ